MTRLSAAAMQDQKTRTREQLEALDKKAAAIAADLPEDFDEADVLKALFNSVDRTPEDYATGIVLLMRDGAGKYPVTANRMVDRIEAACDAAKEIARLTKTPPAQAIVNLLVKSVKSWTESTRKNL